MTWKNCAAQRLRGKPLRAALHTACEVLEL